MRSDLSHVALGMFVALALLVVSTLYFGFWFFGAVWYVLYAAGWVLGLVDSLVHSMRAAA